MTRGALALVAVAALAASLGACEAEKDQPEEAALKAECRQLMAHIFQITPRPEGGAPEADPARIQALVAAVPIEDIDQCAKAKDRTVITCMQAAHDVTALRGCIPK